MLKNSTIAKPKLAYLLGFLLAPICAHSAEQNNISDDDDNVTCLEVNQSTCLDVNQSWTMPLIKAVVCKGINLTPDAINGMPKDGSAPLWIRSSFVSHYDAYPADISDFMCAILSNTSIKTVHIIGEFIVSAKVMNAIARHSRNCGLFSKRLRPDIGPDVSEIDLFLDSVGSCFTLVSRFDADDKESIETMESTLNELCTEEGKVQLITRRDDSTLLYFERKSEVANKYSL